MGKIKLGLSRLPLPEKIAKARQIITALTTNQDPRTPSPALADVTAAVDAVEAAAAAAQAARQDAKTRFSDQNNKEDVLDRLLTQLAAYVESVFLRLVPLAVSLLFFLPSSVQAAPLILATSITPGCNGTAATLTITLNNTTYLYYGNGLYYHFDSPSTGVPSPGNPTVLTIPSTLAPGPHTLLITTSSAPTGGSGSPTYTFIVPSCGPTACVPPPNTSMVGWYSFDELVGSTAENLATGNTGVLINGPNPVPAGKVAGALNFDGFNDYVESPSTILTNFGPANTPTLCGSETQGGYSACLGNFSIDAWVRIPPSATLSVMVIVDKRTNFPNLKGYSFFVDHRRLGLQLADGIGRKYSNYVSSVMPSLYDGNWHHIAVTVDRLLSDGIKWYYDGEPIIDSSGDPTDRQGSLVNTSPLRIGTRTASTPLTGWFNGDIDELELFNRVLTVPEVLSIYSAGPFGKCK